MGNGVPAAVRGTGQVCLKMTSGKTLVLKVEGRVVCAIDEPEPRFSLAASTTGS